MKKCAFYCCTTYILGQGWVNFLTKVQIKECKCCGIAQLSVKTTGKTYLAFIVLITKILYYSHFLSILALVHNFICCFSPLADNSFLGVYFLWCPHSMSKHIEVYNVKFICIFCVMWYGASVCLLLVSWVLIWMYSNPSIWAVDFQSVYFHCFSWKTSCGTWLFRAPRQFLWVPAEWAEVA